jgi:acyl-CoA reductase-like NAD-dependent aldehyde dehydrogenase
VYQILAEAGIPPGVIQFVPGPPAEVVAQAISHPSFAALHFTGSTFIFKKLWKDIAANLDNYKGYPRIVGETGGKNFHVVHKSADMRNAALQTIRGGFEYQGAHIICRVACRLMMCVYRAKMLCIVEAIRFLFALVIWIQTDAPVRGREDYSRATF